MRDLAGEFSFGVEVEGGFVADKEDEGGVLTGGGGDELDKFGEVPGVPFSDTHGEGVDVFVELVGEGDGLDDHVVRTVDVELYEVVSSSAPFLLNRVIGEERPTLTFPRLYECPNPSCASFTSPLTIPVPPFANKFSACNLIPLTNSSVLSPVSHGMCRPPWMEEASVRSETPRRTLEEEVEEEGIRRVRMDCSWEETMPSETSLAFSRASAAVGL